MLVLMTVTTAPRERIKQIFGKVRGNFGSFKKPANFSSSANILLALKSVRLIHKFRRQNRLTEIGTEKRNVPNRSIASSCLFLWRIFQDFSITSHEARASTFFSPHALGYHPHRSLAIAHHVPREAFHVWRNFLPLSFNFLLRFRPFGFVRCNTSETHDL